MALWLKVFFVNTFPMSLWLNDTKITRIRMGFGSQETSEFVGPHFAETWVKTWRRQRGLIFIHILHVQFISGWWFQTFFIFHFIYGMSSFPLTNSIIFQDGFLTTNQIWFYMVLRFYWLVNRHNGHHPWTWNILESRSEPSSFYAVPLHGAGRFINNPKNIILKCR